MKCFIILIGFVAAANAGVLAPSLLSTGTSVQSRTQDGLGNYAFAYDEAGATGGTFRRESGSPAGVVIGSYGLRAADGRQRIVNYVADAAGFRANVQTNEPGVDPVPDPAATLVNKAGIAAAPLAVAAPALAGPLSLAAAAPAIAAPLPAAPALAGPLGLAAAPALAGPLGIAAPLPAAPALAGPLSLAAGPLGIAAPGLAGPLGIAAPALPAIAPAGLPASSIAVPSYGGLTTIQATGPLAAPAAPLALAHSKTILGAPGLLSAKLI